MTDKDPQVLQLIRTNLGINHIQEGDRLKVRQLSWGKDVASFESGFDIIFGSDIVYVLYSRLPSFTPNFSIDTTPPVPNLYGIPSHFCLMIKGYLPHIVTCISHLFAVNLAFFSLTQVEILC